VRGASSTYRASEFTWYHMTSSRTAGVGCFPGSVTSQCAPNFPLLTRIHRPLPAQARHRKRRHRQLSGGDCGDVAEVPTSGYQARTEALSCLRYAAGGPAYGWCSWGAPSMKRAVLVALLVFASSSVGCGLLVDAWQSTSNSNAITKLQVGMKRDDVIALMGQPEKREAYGKTEFLIYRTNHTGMSDAEDFTPIAIADGKVVGWGRNFYDTAVQSKIQADVNTRNR
jgi:outer membrane protein assembly factor BamE (lipoprotein component of BamABCDE complex)